MHGLGTPQEQVDVTVRTAPLAEPAAASGEAAAGDGALAVETARTFAEAEGFHDFHDRHNWHPESNRHLLFAALEARICNESYEEVSIYVFAPTVKGIWLNGLRMVTSWVGRIGRAVASRFGVLARIKGKWRRQLVTAEPRRADAAADPTEAP